MRSVCGGGRFLLGQVASTVRPFCGLVSAVSCGLRGRCARAPDARALWAHVCVPTWAETGDRPWCSIGSLPLDFFVRLARCPTEVALRTTCRARPDAGAVGRMVLNRSRRPVRAAPSSARALGWTLTDAYCARAWAGYPFNQRAAFSSVFAVLGLARVATAMENAGDEFGSLLDRDAALKGTLVLAHFGVTSVKQFGRQSVAIAKEDGEIHRSVQSGAASRARSVVGGPPQAVGEGSAAAELDLRREPKLSPGADLQGKREREREICVREELFWSFSQTCFRRGAPRASAIDRRNQQVQGVASGALRPERVGDGLRARLTLLGTCYAFVTPQLFQK